MNQMQTITCTVVCTDDSDENNRPSFERKILPRFESFVSHINSHLPVYFIDRSLNVETVRSIRFQVPE